MKKNAQIFLAGSGGMAGSAILRELRKQGYTNILAPRHSDLDLLNQAETQEFFKKNAIEHVFIAAARVGGIHANNIQPAQFIYENLMIESNIIHASYLSSVKTLLFLGSSCIYPRNARQPMAEDCLLSGSLELTNEPYSIAKIAGIKLCESYNRQYGTDYRSLMPTNLYGQGDNFHLEHSHVIPAFIHKFHIAKEQNKDSVVLWGSGSPHREFLHVDDLAKACLHFMNMPREDFHSRIDPRVSQVNVGTGVDIALIDLASLIKGIVGYEGKTMWDSSMPDGTPQKLLNVSRAEGMGWKAKISLEDGLKQTYAWFLENIAAIRK